MSKEKKEIRDMTDKELEELNLIINTSFLINESLEISVKNIEIGTLNNLTKLNILKTILLDVKWYMYGIYDKIQIEGINYIITNKTKKKIEIARYN
ncbi:hypothetical protein FDF26_13825 [Clostridium botulinum]|nr:hypothetical protein [Clostridium botulinum]